MMGTAMNGREGNGRRGGSTMLVWGGAAALLLAPLVAMQFTREVNWDGFDFALFGAMLAVACGIYELAARSTGSLAYRAGVGLAVATAFALVSINLAVGIIGNEGNPANLMFAGVLGVALVGAVVARFRAGGMARAMVAAAVAQVLVAVAALVGGEGNILIITGLFAALWLTAARLFAVAARGPAAA